ncbi:MAG TPA: hypothetical protein VF070_18140 [Streptosporangiaceae bacterium]
MHDPQYRSGHSPGTLTDPELAAILPVIAGPAGEFRHRQHIHLAFWAVRRYGMPAATDRVCDWIRHLAAYQRAPQKYHHTVSRAWMELVAHHVAEDGLSRIAAGARPTGSAEPPSGDFDAFAGRHPALLDKRLLSRHYRSATLASTPARQSWVEPDLAPFPR